MVKQQISAIQAVINAYPSLTKLAPFTIHYQPCDAEWFNILEFETEQERTEFLKDPDNAEWICEWRDYYCQEN